MRFLKVLISLMALTLNSAFVSIVLLLIKLFWLLSGFRKFYDESTKFFYFIWIKVNEIILVDFLKIHVDFIGVDQLSPNKWYHIVSNHQSFMDILLIQIFCYRNNLNNKFFMKQSLLFFPFIGISCWGLDFVFIKRFSRKDIKDSPDKVSKLHNYIAEKCKSYMSTPCAVVNFVEGTRANKQKMQHSKYKKLLAPQPMGLSLMINAIPVAEEVIDFSINYSILEPSFLKILYQQPSKTTCSYRVVAVPDGLSGNYRSDKSFRKRFNSWLQQFWLEKDNILDNLTR